MSKNKSLRHQMVMAVLKEYDLDSEAVWDCHGTPVIKHSACEAIETKAGIKFDAPVILEIDGKSKVCSMIVTGHMGEVSKWSTGEAAPSNNKNSYPVAMAEKRAKDRVILKLVNLHGLAYSEDEADDFKAPKTAPKNNGTANGKASKNTDARELYKKLSAAAHKFESISDLDDWEQNAHVITARKSLPADWARTLTQEIEKIREIAF